MNTKSIHGNSWLRTAFLALTALSLPCTGPLMADERSKPETYYYLVFSNPVPGTEAEFNRWYGQEHAPDVVSIPGFVDAQRFVLADAQLHRAAITKPKYLVIYKVTTYDLSRIQAEINRRIQNGETRISPTFDRHSAYSAVYRALKDEGVGAGGEPPDSKPGKPETYFQIVFSDPVPGREKAFDRWLVNKHAPSVAGAPGFVSWHLGVLSDQQLGPPPTGASRYLAIYKIVTTDLPAVIRSFHTRIARTAIENINRSPASDNRRVYGYTYRAIGPALSGDDIRHQRALHPGGR